MLVSSNIKEDYRPRSKEKKMYERISDGVSSVASSNVYSSTVQTNNSSLFPSTASYAETQFSSNHLFGDTKDKTSSLNEQMLRLNLLAKYNKQGCRRLIQEHGEDFVILDKNGFITFKPKLKMPIPPGKFARWFQVVDPNATIRDDIKMARGVLRKDRFQDPRQLDAYLGIKQALEEAARIAEESKCNSSDQKKEQQYRVKRVRNKLKHWNAMYKQLHDAIGSVDNSTYTMREKVQHVDQICSIYIGRAERAIDCFYAEPAAHFMLDMVVSLQKKLADARAINQSYQSILLQDDTAIV